MLHFQYPLFRVHYQIRSPKRARDCYKLLPQIEALTADYVQPFTFHAMPQETTATQFRVTSLDLQGWRTTPLPRRRRRRFRQQPPWSPWLYPVLTTQKTQARGCRHRWKTSEQLRKSEAQSAGSEGRVAAGLCERPPAAA